MADDESLPEVPILLSRMSSKCPYRWPRPLHSASLGVQRIGAREEGEAWKSSNSTCAHSREHAPALTPLIWRGGWGGATRRGICGSESRGPCKASRLWLMVFEIESAFGGGRGGGGGTWSTWAQGRKERQKKVTGRYPQVPSGRPTSGAGVACREGALPVDPTFPGRSSLPRRPSLRQPKARGLNSEQ